VRALLRRVNQWLSANFGWLVMVLAVLFGGIYAAEVHHEHVRAHQESVRAACQAEYNHAFATQLTERSRLSAAVSEAQTHILSEIGKALSAPPAKSEKEEKARVKAFLKLFSDFDKNTDQISKDRAATPLPPIPDCG